MQAVCGVTCSFMNAHHAKRYSAIVLDVTFSSASSRKGVKETWHDKVDYYCACYFRFVQAHHQ